MKKKKALLTASLLSCAFAAAAYVEGTGYALFDREKGDNILCRIDPFCRQLTPGEKSLARKYFGDSINYSSVKIFNRALAGLFGHNKSGMAPNGNIYFADTEDQSENFAETDIFHQRHFIHELVHVAQHQGGDNLPLEALMTYLTYEFKYKDAYEYRIDSHAPFHLMNLEQQAEIMENYFIQRRTLEAETTYTASNGKKIRFPGYGIEWLNERCQSLSQYEAKLQQQFPVQPDELCPQKPAATGLKYAP